MANFIVVKQHYGVQQFILTLVKRAHPVYL